MGFVFFHMLGNLKMYLGPVHFDEYAEWLRELLVPFLPRTAALWIMRIGLIVAFALHILAAYQLTLPEPGGPEDEVHGVATTSPPTTPAARCAGAASSSASSSSGTCSTCRGPAPATATSEATPTATSTTASAGGPVALLYIVANIALAFHLFHGAWSLFQTMGWSNPRFNVWRRNFAIGFAAVVCIPNISFPIAVLAGVISQ